MLRRDYQRSSLFTTGVGRETQPKETGDSILCHFYPIPTHNGDMSDALGEAVASLAKALHNNMDLMLIRYVFVFGFLKRSLTVLLLLHF